MVYIIAYTDENGKGLDSNSPWLHGEYEENQLESCKERANDLINLGMCDVTIFKMEEDYMEVIPWSYINEHKVDF